MRKFKEVGASEGLQFCGLATLKLPMYTCEMNVRLKINYINAAIFVYCSRKNKIYKLCVTSINGMSQGEKLLN